MIKLTIRIWNDDLKYLKPLGKFLQIFITLLLLSLNKQNIIIKMILNIIMFYNDF